MRAAIAGYGNIGRSVERLVGESAELELVGVFTRRKPESVETLGARVYHAAELDSSDCGVDLVFLCYGSSSDTPVIGPHIAEHYDTVDCFDNHVRLSEYKASMDRAARRGGGVSMVSFGWDPGFLSLIRLYSYSFIPHPSVNTFWGRGVSQGHSEAIRRIDGVRDAVQYTLPSEDALTLASLVSHPLADTERHRRVCYVVADEDKEASVTEAILGIGGYFSGYRTEIHFISDEELRRYHSSVSHRGRIYALGSSGRYKEIKHSLYLDLDIGSNPDFTASVMLSAARAIGKIKKNGGVGAYSPFDVPPSYLVPLNRENVNDYL